MGMCAIVSFVLNGKTFFADEVDVVPVVSLPKVRALALRAFRKSSYGKKRLPKPSDAYACVARLSGYGPFIVLFKA